MPIKMCKVIATSSKAEHDVREEFYEKYAEDFQLLKRYEIPSNDELIEENSETDVREEARALGISNWHNKKLTNLVKEIAKVKQAEKDAAMKVEEIKPKVALPSIEELEANMEDN